MAPPDKKDGAESNTKEPDWGKVYSRLLYHYKMDYDSIQERTIPQIDALTLGLPEQISIGGVGMPGLFGISSNDSAPSPTDKPPKLSEFMNFANAFNGI